MLKVKMLEATMLEATILEAIMLEATMMETIMLEATSFKATTKDTSIVVLLRFLLRDLRVHLQKSQIEKIGAPYYKF